MGDVSDVWPAEIKAEKILTAWVTIWKHTGSWARRLRGSASERISLERLQVVQNSPPAISLSVIQNTYSTRGVMDRFS